MYSIRFEKSRSLYPFSRISSFDPQFLIPITLSLRSQYGQNPQCQSKANEWGLYKGVWICIIESAMQNSCYLVLSHFDTMCQFPSESGVSTAFHLYVLGQVRNTPATV